MNCLSLNISGTKEDFKTQWVCRLKVAHKINFIGLHTYINTDGCWDSTDHDSRIVRSGLKWQIRWIGINFGHTSLSEFKIHQITFFFFLIVIGY